MKKLTGGVGWQSRKREFFVRDGDLRHRLEEEQLRDVFPGQGWGKNGTRRGNRICHYATWKNQLPRCQMELHCKLSEIVESIMLNIFSLSIEKRFLTFFLQWETPFLTSCYLKAHSHVRLTGSAEGRSVKKIENFLSLRQRNCLPHSHVSNARRVNHPLIR